MDIMDTTPDNNNSGTENSVTEPSAAELSGTLEDAAMQDNSAGDGEKSPETKTPAPASIPFTEEELAERIKEAFMKDARLDAAIDLWIRRFQTAKTDEEKDANDDQLREDLGLKSDKAWNRQHVMINERIKKRRRYLSTLQNDQKIPHEEQSWGIITFADHEWKGKDDPELLDLNRHLVDSMERPHLGSHDPRSIKAAEYFEAENKLLESVRATVRGHKADATFACGGSIPDKRVTVAFQAAGEDGPVQKIAFPPKDAMAGIAPLVQASEAASFGLGGEAVLDPSYRSALKLDNENFTTSFHPYDFGIVNAIQQLLLPSVYPGGNYKPYIVTELYKLNIYAGPSGLFKPHVDTPRSETQFGSLVVCLPCPHEGGELVVRHNGKSIEFNWGGENPTAIQWAAFYSDCEHEVLQVKEGHRCTLTYNLYFDSERLLDTIPESPLFSIESLPLFQEIRQMLSNSSFLPRGGVVGFYCDHQYPHHGEEREQLPRSLKGVDAAVYSVLLKLLPCVTLRPIFDHTPDPYRCLDIEKHYKESVEKFHALGNGRRENGRPNRIHLRYLENDGKVIPGEEFSNFETRFQALLRKRTVQGWEIVPGIDGTGDEPECNHSDDSRYCYLHDCPDVTRERLVGRQFDTWRDYTSAEYQDERGAYPVLSEVADAKPLVDVRNVRWLSYLSKDERHKKSQAAGFQMAYGNEPSVRLIYSCAVILATVPPYTEQRGNV